MKLLTKRIVCLLLTIVMAVGFFPASAVMIRDETAETPLGGETLAAGPAEAPAAPLDAGEAAQLASDDLTIPGYTRVTELPSDGLEEGQYLIVATYDSKYYMLYPGATGAGTSADNAARVEVDANGTATGYKVGHGSTYDSAAAATDFSLAENTIAKSSDKYSVTAVGPSNTTYYLFNGSNTVYNTSSPSTVTLESVASSAGYFRLLNSASNAASLIFYSPSAHMNFNQGGNPDSHDDYFPNMMLFQKDTLEEPDSLAIPGYNQVTQLNQIKADREYLIVAQAPDETFYALYLNAAGADNSPGSTAYPNCAATLAVSGSTVSAVSTADTSTAVAMSGLHVTIAATSNGYTIKNSTHALNLRNTMYVDANSAPDLALSFVASGDQTRFQVHNTLPGGGGSRYLTFNVNSAASSETHYPSHPTGFCGWDDPQTSYIPTYLFIEGELPVEPGIDLPQMLSGDQIGGGSTENADPNGQNSWVFTGGRAAQGSFADVAGARTWAGHFEEYVRYTNAKQLQPTGETSTPYFQRHVINAAYTGQTLAGIVSTFNDRIAALKPRAVTYLVDEGAGSAADFATNLNALITKSLALRNNTGMLVVVSLTAADQTAVEAVANALPDAQKRRVLPLAITLTDAQKTGGFPNALGHLEMAKKLADAVAGSTVSTAANWPYGAISGSVMASNFPTKTAVDAHHTYEIPSTLNTAQRTVQTKTADKANAMTWLFMGDSITHGSAWTGGFDSLAQLFEKFVKDDLQRGSDVVINAGSSGATTESTINDLNRRLVKYSPDVVVVMLGTNDAASSISENTFKTNIRTILNKIIAKNAIPVLRTPPPTSKSGYDIATYAQYIRDVAAEEAYAGNVILVDQYARWNSMNWGDVFSRDSLHPDEAGHLWFVHQLIKELALWNDSYQVCQLEYVEMNEPEAIAIPGYTQMTNLNQLDENKGYLIVSKDAQGNLYALYPSEEGKTLGAGALVSPGAENDGARAAKLTVAGNTVTATWLKDNSALEVKKLMFSINAGTGSDAGKYIFTAFNGRHLNMQDNMFTDGSVALTVTNRGTAALYAFEIKNTTANRVLDFTKSGDPNAFGSTTTQYGTDFWCPRSMKMAVYLFASDTATVPTAKETIEALITEDVPGLVEANYTRASWATLQAALTAARTALAGYTSTMTGDEEVFVTARDNLQNALDNLQAKPVIPTVPDGATKIDDWRDMVPETGTTKNEPFASGTAGSEKFRIPAIITLQHQTGANADKNGRLLAAIDARWNHTGDACGLDTIVSYSDDNGGNWAYNFPNYFGDGTDSYQTYATAFIDPQLTEGKDGTIYMMVDLWTGGVALNTAPMRPASATGYVEIGGKKRLVLYTSPVTANQSDTNYAYYVGDFDGDYAPVYAPMAGDDLFVGYYIDKYYYLYYTAESDFAAKTPANDKIYCQRLGASNTYIQQNVFFYNATLHARNVSYLWIVKSTDGGETWSEPLMINDQVRTGEDQFYGVGPGAGLCVDTAGSSDSNRIPDGMILMPVYIWSNEHAGFIYSKDGGATWKRSDSYSTTTDRDSSESCLVQISDTTVRHFYRDSWSNSMVVRYTDHTWNPAKNDGQGGWDVGEIVRVDSAARWGACQLSAIQYSRKVNGKDLILYSVPASTGGRAKGVIHAFLVNNDAGHTMELYNTYAVNGNNAYAYSSLTETENGNIALLYESTSDAVIFEVISIDKIIPSLTVAGYEGSYDGQPHSITVTASDGAAFQYSIDGGSSWSSTKPSFTDAGTYTVKVKATWSGSNWAGSVKGTSSEASATVTIGKVTPTLSITTDTGAVVAPGQAITFTISGVPAGTAAEGISLACDVEEHGAIPLTQGSNGTWTGTHGAAEEASTHNFTATFTGNDNYNQATATYQVQVVDIGVTIRAFSGPYDGQPHSIAVTPAEGVTLTYCETENGTYADTLPSYTNAGTYTTYYKAVKAGMDPVTGYAHVTITRAVPSISIICNKGTELSTNDLPLTLTISGVPAQGKFTLTAFGDAIRNLTRNDDGTWTAAPALPPVSRSYTFNAVFDPTQDQEGDPISSPNYEQGAESITITVTRPASSEDFQFSFASGVEVDPATPTVGDYTVIYDAQAHDVLGALVRDAGVTLSFHVPIEDGESGEPTWAETVPTFVQPGTYTVSCMATKGNSAQLLTVNLHIEERNIPTNLVIAADPTELAGGGRVTLTVTGAPAVGTLTVTSTPALAVNKTNQGTYTAQLPNEDGSYTFTVSYSGAGSYKPAETTCTVTVTKSEVVTPVGPSGGGGGGSSQPVTTKTETETKEDGTKVTTVTMSDGSVTETVERPDGSKFETVTTKNGDVTLTATDPSGEELAKVEIPAVMPTPKSEFQDLDSVPWAKEAINNFAGLDLMRGVGSNQFDPNAPLTRGSLATVLYRLSQGKSDYNTTFKDVAQGKYYSAGVAWAAKVNVVKGISADIFAPNNIITREQLAVMLCRYANLLGMDISADTEVLDQFADRETIGAWATDGIAWCVKQGILKGKGANGLDPTAEVTRAEVAVMLDRFLTLIK